MEEFIALLEEFNVNFQKSKEIVENKLKNDRQTPQDYLLLAEYAHYYWIFSEILKGRTSFLEDENKDVGNDNTIQSTKEMIDLMGRKIQEAKNKLNKKSNFIL